MRYLNIFVTTLLLAGCADLTQPSGAVPAQPVAAAETAPAAPTPANAPGVPTPARAPTPMPSPAPEGCGAN